MAAERTCCTSIATQRCAARHHFRIKPNARQPIGKKASILTGKGGSFCAGADLKELAGGKGVAFAWADETRGLTRSRLSKPVIAAVEGHAVAAGLALAVWCDLRVIDDTAVFGVFCRRYGV